MAFSKDKNRILLGLELGTKLHDLMRERDMPSKALLEEWRDNDAEFDAAYLVAVEKGRVKRGEPAPKPAPVVTDEDGHQHEIPRSTALRNEQPAVAKPVLAAPAQLEPAKDNDTVLRDRMLALRQAGGRTTDLLKNERGFDGVKLARWRRDPVFKAAWDAAGQKKASPTVEVAATAPAPEPSWPQEYESLAKDFEQFREASQREVAEHKERADKLQAFKDFVHNALTTEGIDQHDAENMVSGCRVGARLTDVFQQLAGYKEWGEDVKRLTRELDVALFGENAAAQASLCDLVAPARKLAESFNAFAQKYDEQNEQATPVLELHGTTPSVPEHPGAILTALMRKAGTRRAQLAEALGMKPATLKDLLAGYNSISLELCGKLEKLCWGTAEVWARRQVDYNNYRQSLAVAA